MTGITHKKAQRYLRAAADRLLRDDQCAALDAHLRECASCRVEADELNAFETRLKRTFQARWDVQDGPYENVMANIGSQTRRIIMTNRIKMGLRFLAGIVLLLGLAIVFNAIFSKWRTSPASIATSTISPTVLPTTVSATLQPYNSLIAFVSEKSGNYEIYTMHSDGSHVTNLTNNPAGDYSPAWSPDGSRIAFVSERNGNAEIFVMNADGSGLSQLTQNHAGYDGFFKWSPNGRQIAYISSASQDPNIGQLYVINADGSGKAILTNETGSYYLLGWSPDSQKIVYQKQNLDSDPNAGIYIINTDGTNGQKLLGPDNVQSQSIKWVDAQHFYAISGFTPWQLYRFNTDGTPPDLVASYPSPISTWFGSGSNLNYVVKDFDTWIWYHIDGITKTHLSTWPSFSAKCQKYAKDYYLKDASNSLSDNGEYGLVTVYCDDGYTWFYYVNADGSKIELLLTDPIPLEIMAWAAWSPDGQYIVVDLGNSQTAIGDLYLIDVEKTLQDPSLRPIQLTTDHALAYDVVWQPQP